MKGIFKSVVHPDPGNVLNPEGNDGWKLVNSVVPDSGSGESDQVGLNIFPLNRLGSFIIIDANIYLPGTAPHTRALSFVFDRMRRDSSRKRMRFY